MARKKILTGIFALVVVFSGVCQEMVFAPFVSQLEGEIRNNLIRLSWKDARDIQGPVYVYRSETPFSGMAALPAPIEVPYGAGSYLDEADFPGVFYYFVAASDEWDKKYILPLPYTNTVMVTVEPENVPGFISSRQVPSSQTAPGPAHVQGIEGINARLEENRVVISFTGADNQKNLILYRSLNPLRRQEDLLSALIIRQKVRSPIIDYPLPGISYYYALIYEEDLSAGFVTLRQGSNVVGPVYISTELPSSRNLPVPELGSSVPPRLETAELGPSAADAVFSLEKRPAGVPKREMVIFPEDLTTNNTGEDLQLRLVVQGYFSLKEWDKAEEEFRRFLVLPRSKYNQAKARFYLGQVYYFKGKPRDALFEFLEARPILSDETGPWIQAVLGEFTR